VSVPKRAWSRPIGIHKKSACIGWYGRYFL